uniref:hypothetical protein n=1 Tax=Tateyamaria pelophila TaxID=328415 RepID=UPI001CBB49BF
ALPPSHTHRGVSPRLTRSLTLIVAPHMTTIRTFSRGLVEFAEGFRILWEAQLAEKARKVDKAREGVQAKGPATH